MPKDSGKGFKIGAGSSNLGHGEAVQEAQDALWLQENVHKGSAQKKKR